MGAELIEKLPGFGDVLTWAKQVDPAEVRIQIGLDSTEEEALKRLEAGPPPEVPVLVSTRADVLRAAKGGILFFSYASPPDDEPGEIGDAIFEFLSESGFLVTYTGDPSVKIGIAIDRFDFITTMAQTFAEVIAQGAEKSEDDEPCPECTGTQEAKRREPLPSSAMKLDFSTARYEAHLWFNGTEWVYNVRDTEADGYSLERGRSQDKAEVLAAAKACVHFLEHEMN